MRIRFEEYPKWLSTELDKLVKPTTVKGRRLVDESIRALDEGREFFDRLSRKGDKDMAGKKDPVSYKAARLVGHSAREAQQMLAKAQPPHEVTWESLKAFKDQLSSLSKTLRETRAKTVAQLSGFYLLDMRSFGGVNDRILKQSERITHFLEGEGSTLQKARTLTSSLTEAEAVSHEISEQVREGSDLARQRESMKTASATLASNLDKIDNDPLVKELLSTEKTLRNESRQFKTEQLAHLKRPLRRLGELSERGEVPLGPDARDALRQIIVTPYRSFLSERTGSYFVSIMESLRVATTSGKMGLKPRKAARVLAQLDQLTSKETSRLQTDGRRLLSRRKQLFQNPNCRLLYESRKEIIDQMGREKKAIEDVMEKERALDARSKLLRSRLDEILELLGSKTHQYTGQEVQLEKPLEITQSSN